VLFAQVRFEPSTTTPSDSSSAVVFVTLTFQEPRTATPSASSSAVVFQTHVVLTPSTSTPNACRPAALAFSTKRYSESSARTPVPNGPTLTFWTRTSSLPSVIATSKA